MTIQHEIWRAVPIEQFSDRYQVSNLGNVRSAWFGRLMKPQGQNSGYKMAILTKNRKVRHMLVHRLVALAFLDAVPGKNIVNHINGNKSDNRLQNLEWATHSENMRHAFGSGLAKAHGLPVVWKYRQVVAKKGDYELAFESLKQASDSLRISRTGISNNLAGRSQSCGGYIFSYAS